MKITPYLSLNENMNISGFVNVGKYTPDEQKTVLGDHGLVLIFQPFTQSWIQPVGAFLTKNAANGSILSQIVLEAIILLENVGLNVDGITSDGAQWNRNMWSLFNVDENSRTLHPYDENRHLYFLSDFPHLIKSVRNYVISKKKFKVRTIIAKIREVTNSFLRKIFIVFLRRYPMGKWM